MSLTVLILTASVVATILQAAWRGRAARRALAAQASAAQRAQMQAVRERLAEATAAVAYEPAKSVGARTKSALEILLANKQLSVVTKACQTLGTIPLPVQSALAHRTHRCPLCLLLQSW